MQLHYALFQLKQASIVL